jgi:hypothetical protein
MDCTLLRAPRRVRRRAIAFASVPALGHRGFSHTFLGRGAPSGGKAPGTDLLRRRRHRRQLQLRGAPASVANRTAHVRMKMRDGI